MRRYNHLHECHLSKGAVVLIEWDERAYNVIHLVSSIIAHRKQALNHCQRPAHHRGEILVYAGRCRVIDSRTADILSRLEYDSFGRGTIVEDVFSRCWS